MILLPLISMVYIAYKRNISPYSKDFSNAKLMYGVILFCVVVNFMFSSYLPRNMLFPVLVAVSYFIASIKMEKVKERI